MKYLDRAENPFVLISGSSSPSSSISISDETRKDGDYENGIRMDVENMRNYVSNETICELLGPLRGGSKQKVLDFVKDSARLNKEEDGGSINIYYTGYGETGTGDWCFDDGTISLKELINTVEEVFDYFDSYTLNIYADCCYSGLWASQMDNIKLKYYSSTLNIYTSSNNSTDNGGIFTLLITKGNYEQQQFTEYIGFHRSIEYYDKVSPMKKLDYDFEAWISDHLLQETLNNDQDHEKQNNKSGGTSQYLNKEIRLRILKDYVSTDKPLFKPQDFKIEIGYFELKTSEIKWELKENSKTIHIIDNNGNKYDLDFKGPGHAKWFADEKLKAYKEQEVVDT